MHIYPYAELLDAKRNQKQAFVLSIGSTLVVAKLISLLSSVQI